MKNRWVSFGAKRRRKYKDYIQCDIQWYEWYCLVPVIHDTCHMQPHNVGKWKYPHGWPWCVFLCVFYRSPVCAVCPNHEVVVFQPQTVTAPDLGSVANITTVISLPPCMSQLRSGSLFSPPPIPIYYRSPIFQPPTTLISLFTHASTPPISSRFRETIHLDSAPTRRPPPLVCAFLPWRADQWFTCASLWMHSLAQIHPLWRPLPATRSLSDPGFLLSKGTFLPLPDSTICTHIHPLPSLTGVPISCRHQVVGVVFFFPPNLVHPPCPLRVQSRLLVFSGVLFSFSGVLLH